MHFLHFALCWLTAHCWASRAGATWRARRDPHVAGEIFISSSFLRFSMGLLVLITADITLLVATGHWQEVAKPMLYSALIGAGTGLLHGAAEY